MKSASDIAYSRITPEETVRLKEALGAKDFWAIPSVSFTAERKLLQEVIKYTAVNLSIQGTNEVDRGKDIDRVVSDIYENVKSGFLANQHTAIQKQIALLETDIENHLRDLQANPREVDIQGYNPGTDKEKSWQEIADKAFTYYRQSGNYNPFDAVNLITQWVLLNVEDTLNSKAASELIHEYVQERGDDFRRHALPDKPRKTAFILGGIAAGKSHLSEALLESGTEDYQPENVVFCDTDHYKYTLLEHAKRDGKFQSGMENSESEGLWVHNESVITASQAVKLLGNRAATEATPNTVINMTFPGQREMNLALARGGEVDVFLILLDKKLARQQEI